jgi:hypothetical protein
MRMKQKAYSNCDCGGPDLSSKIGDLGVEICSHIAEEGRKDELAILQIKRQLFISESDSRGNWLMRDGNGNKNQPSVRIAGSV